MEKVKLFGTSSSPFVIRIVWALTLKGVDYRITYEDLTNKSPELLKYNPVHKKVPVLVHNEVPICELLVILEYIDETWKDISPFLPQTLLIEPKHVSGKNLAMNSFPIDVGFTIVLRFGNEQEEAKVTILANLKLVEELLNEKTFYNGKSFGFLDLVFVWLADYCGPLEVVTNLKLLDEEKISKLRAWKKKFLEIPPKTENWPDQESLVVQFRNIKENRKGN